ncbi:hypothetical protein AAFF_G00049030 [Aldrovandia affinis]|uniref:Uncharacterized protein n=1 Tax=Aldrovandia affinis TaxID=143900 RepID=A0AAD7S1D0_9TELE|nr:hypothetical protein AAFF_G00049030 [Aldrovandia affinis]
MKSGFRSVCWDVMCALTAQLLAQRRTITHASSNPGSGIFDLGLFALRALLAGGRAAGGWRFERSVIRSYGCVFSLWRREQSILLKGRNSSHPLRHDRTQDPLVQRREL